MDCLFCRIAAGAVPATVVHRDEHVVAFRDINPQAPTHVLVIPVRHIASVADLGPEDDDLTARLVTTATRVAREAGLERSGYRLVTNTGAGAGQSVAHLHWHLLGGRAMTWPPG